MSITAEQIKAAFNSTRTPSRINSGACKTCLTPYAYILDPAGEQLGYDTNCDCKPHNPVVEEVPWGRLAADVEAIPAVAEQLGLVAV